MEHGARSTEHGARSTEHGARSTERGACSMEHKLPIFLKEITKTVCEFIKFYFNFHFNCKF